MKDYKTVFGQGSRFTDITGNVYKLYWLENNEVLAVQDDGKCVYCEMTYWNWDNVEYIAGGSMSTRIRASDLLKDHPPLKLGQKWRHRCGEIYTIKEMSDEYILIGETTHLAYGNPIKDINEVFHGGQTYFSYLEG